MEKRLAHLQKKLAATQKAPEKKANADGTTT
jgi:hypothetical protein